MPTSGIKLVPNPVVFDPSPKLQVKILSVVPGTLLKVNNCPSLSHAVGSSTRKSITGKGFTVTVIESLAGAVQPSSKVTIYVVVVVGKTVCVDPLGNPLSHVNVYGPPLPDPTVADAENVVFSQIQIALFVSTTTIRAGETITSTLIGNEGQPSASIAKTLYVVVTAGETL